MPVEFFKRDEGSLSLDFLPDALDENPKLDGKMFDVFSFKKAESGKGYMLYTSDFIAWFFKKDKIMVQVLEALDYYCKTGTGYQFVIQVESSLKSKFNLGLDTDREVTYIPLENTSYVLENMKSTEGTKKGKKVVEKKPVENPFLKKKTKPVPLPPSTDPLKDGDTI